MSPRARGMLLAALLLALPLALFLPAARGWPGPGRQGPAVFWMVPVACALLSLALFPRLPAIPATRPGGKAPASWRAAPRLLPWIAAAFVIDQSFVGIGHALGWSTFTFGDQHLMGAPAGTAVWALPLCLLLGIFGFERALRGGILGGTAAALGGGRAAALSVLAGVVLAAPSVLLGTGFFEPAYAGAAFLAAACREASFAALYLAGGILPAGLYRGVLYYVEGLGINDINALFFPAVNYASSHPLFYAGRALTAVLGAVVILAGAHRVAHRRPPAGPPGAAS